MFVKKWREGSFVLNVSFHNLTKYILLSLLKVLSYNKNGRSTNRFTCFYFQKAYLERLTGKDFLIFVENLITKRKYSLHYFLRYTTQVGDKNKILRTYLSKEEFFVIKYFTGYATNNYVTDENGCNYVWHTCPIVILIGILH